MLHGHRDPESHPQCWKCHARADGIRGEWQWCSRCAIEYGARLTAGEIFKLKQTLQEQRSRA